MGRVDCSLTAGGDQDCEPIYLIQTNKVSYLSNFIVAYIVIRALRAINHAEIGIREHGSYTAESVSFGFLQVEGTIVLFCIVRHFLHNSLTVEK